MKKRFFLFAIALTFVTEAAIVAVFLTTKFDDKQDLVAVNAVAQSVAEDFDRLQTHVNETSLRYAVIDTEDNLLYKTGDDVRQSLSAAVNNRDTVLDVTVNGEIVGKILIKNEQAAIWTARKKRVGGLLIGLVLLQGVLLLLYLLWIRARIVRPFSSLRAFAERVASGNLDIPLTMDRHNVFGAFTESFDIMRSELKRARAAEAAATLSKKELVLKLSHDIKTPVASIKAAAEVGKERAKDGKTKTTFTGIVQKADQIDTLVANLFNATMQDLQKLDVTPKEEKSAAVSVLLQNADYLHKATLPTLPACLLYFDPLRLQQVFDNLFANSYKYAASPIFVSAAIDDAFLTVTVEDEGGGVEDELLPQITQKFKRGKNAEGKDGAGIGLYLAERFMRAMDGDLKVENGEKGLKVSVCIRLAGEQKANI